MIVDWVPVAIAQAGWTGPADQFRDAISALDNAICQQDVMAALKPPVFDISFSSHLQTPFSQPLIVWKLAAGGAIMLFYTLTELPHSADVRVVP